MRRRSRSGTGFRARCCGRRCSRSRSCSSPSSLIGFLVLRRRGVYFSLLTLAFSALTYAVAFRWTAFTGGENGLGGVTRANVVRRRPRECVGLLRAGRDARRRRRRRAGSASIARRSASCCVAIRENEQRAQFVGYATQRYKQIAYHGLGDADRLRRRAVRVPPSLRVGRSDRRSRSPASCSRW